MVKLSVLLTSMHLIWLTRSMKTFQEDQPCLNNQVMKFYKALRIGKITVTTRKQSLATLKSLNSISRMLKNLKRFGTTASTWQCNTLKIASTRLHKSWVNDYLTFQSMKVLLRFMKLWVDSIKLLSRISNARNLTKLCNALKMLDQRRCSRFLSKRFSNIRKPCTLMMVKSTSWLSLVTCQAQRCSQVKVSGTNASVSLRSKAQST